MINRSKKTIELLCAGGITAALMFAAILAKAQDAGDVQVRSEAVVGGSNSVVIPDLYDGIENVAFEYWVPPAPGRDFKTIGFRPTGGLIVRDGTVFREFRADGSERFSSAFPIDCTKLNFQSPKGQGTQDTFLNDCDASVILLDNTMRIYGNVKGQGLKGIAYDLENPNGANDADECTVTFSNPRTAAEIEAAESRTCGAYRVTKEPPPQITDAIADESDKAIEFRGGPRILVAGDRKSVFAIDITTDITQLDSEDTVTPVATFNGKKIDSFAVASQYLVVSFDDGEIRRYDLTDGTDSYLYQHTILEDPALGKKTPQFFASRNDPDEIVVFALNRAAGNLVVVNPYAADASQVIIDTDGDFTDAFALTNMAMDGSIETINPMAVDARPGESGTFADCEEGETCQLGQIADQLTQSNTTLVEVETFDPSYRMFQSYLVDCRSSGDRPCPIVNCLSAETMDPADGCEQSDPKLQILNLTKLFIDSDSTGEVADLVPNDPVLDPATIPGRYRGEAWFPKVPGVGCKYEDPLPGEPGYDLKPAEGEHCFNNFEFYSFFAVSDVVFAGTFELTIDVDKFRFTVDPVTRARTFISNDGCPVVLPAGATAAEREAEVNDRANVVVHNRDRYDTIPDPAEPYAKPSVLIDWACGSRKVGGFDWSWTSTGLEPADFTALDYLEFAELQLTQLEQFREKKLCSLIDDLDNPGSQFQVLSDPDCGLVQTDVQQVRDKADVCFAALEKPQQGESRENCGALFAQLGNLVETLELSITRPDPTNPLDIPKLKTAYLAEFEARIGAFRFSTEEWLLKVTPAGGIQR
jgi:hypothetical protein